MSFNAKQYQTGIPACCKFQTYEEHRDILALCWGLIQQSINDDKPMNCGECEFATRKIEPADEVEKLVVD